MALTKKELDALAEILEERSRDSAARAPKHGLRKRKPKLAIVKVYPEHPHFAQWQKEVIDEFVDKESPLRNPAHSHYYARFLRGRWLSYGLGVPPEHCACRGARECVCDLKFRDPDFYGLARKIAIANMAKDLEEEARDKKRLRLVSSKGLSVRVQA